MNLNLFYKPAFQLRFFTGLVLIPLVLLFLYLARPLWLGTLLLVMLIIAGREWSKLIPLKAGLLQGVFIASLLVAVKLAFIIPLIWLWTVIFLWGLLLVAVIFFPNSQMIWGFEPLVASFALLLLPILAYPLVTIYNNPQGCDLLVYLFCLVWATDIGAYLVGKQRGMHRFIVNVSPNKTLEGALGGLTMGLFVAILGYIYFRPVEVTMAWFGLALVVILISMLGDLFISMLKRRVHVKDTGKLFPGHGGLLDRLDSFIAALPFFYIGMHYYLTGI